MIYPSFIHYLLTCCCLLNHPPAFSAPITSFVSPQEQLIQEKNTACSLATYQGKSLQKKLGSSSDGLLVFPLVSQSFWEIGWLGMPRGSESNGQFYGFLYVYLNLDMGILFDIILCYDLKDCLLLLLDPLPQSKPADS